MEALHREGQGVAGGPSAAVSWRVLSSVLALALVLAAACARHGTRPPARAESQTPAEPSVPTSPAGRVDPALRSFVDRAVADLAKRRAVDAADIRVVEARAVVWPDGSLGCPRPGMEYTQVLQEGLLIRLELGGRTYAYHGGGGRMPELCEAPRDPPPP